ncbi:hypothetical protein TB1_000681 [Malus domestica]
MICLAKSLAPAITSVQAFRPSSNLEYEASVLNTSNSANAGAVSWYGKDEDLNNGKNPGSKSKSTAVL